MEKINNEKINEKVKEFMGYIECVLDKKTDKSSFEIFIKNVDNQPKISETFLSRDKNWILDLGKISYLDFCKTFLKSAREKYLTSETIGITPVLLKQHHEDFVLGSWTGYSFPIESAVTGNHLTINFMKNNEIENVVDYYKSLNNESEMDQ